MAEETKVTKEKKETVKDPWKEMVKVKFELTREKQKDVFVSVNGKNYQIQRGVEVEVPKPIYEVIQHSQEMDALAIKKQNEMKEI